LHWIQDTLANFPDENAAITEAQLLLHYFASIPRTTSNFGLIHYDFEYNNVFYDEASGSCNVIDFDDAMYHWYEMDIEQALDSLHDYIPPEMFARKKQCFMDGYLTEYNLSDDFAAILPACRRFANLFGYTRIRRSIAEQWDNEPEWLVHLRGNLWRGLKDRSSLFGTEIGVAECRGDNR
jgi:Ser/Thr protein kinase RdoA (MazF antagonist)